MPRVVLTPQLARFVPCPEARVSGQTVAQALDLFFSGHARARGYIFDDQDRLRKHVMVFLNGEALTDRVTLADPVEDEDEIYVMQALSGG
ncbi:MAG: MoaD/ThiS family protein [Verrucomicrobiae bacterium]|nr:MoaD/ThiS family protein [Verrucomicrobiae bacterium]